MGHRAPHRRGFARPISGAIYRCSSKAAWRRALRLREGGSGAPRLVCFSNARGQSAAPDKRRDAVKILYKPERATIGCPFCFVQAGDRWSLNDGPAHCVFQSNSHVPAREILQNLFAFVIFLSHCSGILIDVKGIPPRHQRMPPTTARLRWNRTGTCIAALPLRPCMFAQTKRSHLRGCFSYFPPKKKAASAVFFVS